MGKRELSRGDLVVGIERTGQYHPPLKHTLAVHWTVQMVHPFATINELHNAKTTVFVPVDNLEQL